MEKILICFRHGQTDYNAKKILQGSEVDISLNNNGIKQALSMQNQLENIEIIYSSPSKRALETATIINEEINVPLKIEDDLREISFGIFSHKSKDYIKNNYKDIYEDWLSLEDCKLPKATESKYEAGERFIIALIKICEKEKSNIIGISSHGKILNVVRYLISGEYIPIPTGGILKIKFKNGKLELI